MLGLPANGLAANVIRINDDEAEVGVPTSTGSPSILPTCGNHQINAGAPVNLTNIVDADQGDFNGGTNVVTVNGITLTPGDVAFVRFTVTIQ